MSDGILYELLDEYAKVRQENQWEEQRRIKEIEEKAPQVAKALEKREHFFFSQLKRAINQQAPENTSIEKTMEEHSQTIQRLLVEAGFDKDYLQPIYRCEDCRDTGYVGETLKKRCHCLKKAYDIKKAEKQGLWSNARDTFAHYNEEVYSNEIIPSLGVSQRSYMAFIRQKVYQYADDFPNTKASDMLFVGQSGLGKTFLLQALANKVSEKGYWVNYMTAYRFIELARQAHFSNDWELMEPTIACDLLIIDDLGIEPMMENITIIQLFRTIDQRQQQSKHTVISTNLNSVELQNRYSERIASRLLNPRQCELVAFLGEDVRRREKE